MSPTDEAKVILAQAYIALTQLSESTPESLARDCIDSLIKRVYATGQESPVNWQPVDKVVDKVGPPVDNRGKSVDNRLKAVDNLWKTCG